MLRDPVDAGSRCGSAGGVCYPVVEKASQSAGGILFFGTIAMKEEVER